MQTCANIVDLKMIQNEYLIAKIVFDKAENEHSKAILLYFLIRQIFELHRITKCKFKTIITTGTRRGGRIEFLTSLQYIRVHISRSTSHHPLSISDDYFRNSLEDSISPVLTRIDGVEYEFGIQRIHHYTVPRSSIPRKILTAKDDIIISNIESRFASAIAICAAFCFRRISLYLRTCVVNRKLD